MQNNSDEQLGNVHPVLSLSLADAKLNSELLKGINSTVFQDLNSFNLSASTNGDAIEIPTVFLAEQQEPFSLRVNYLGSTVGHHLASQSAEEHEERRSFIS